MLQTEQDLASSLSLVQGHEEWLFRDTVEKESEVFKAGECRTERIREGLETIESGCPGPAVLSLKAHACSVLQAATALEALHEEGEYLQPLYEVQDKLTDRIFDLEGVERGIERQFRDNMEAQLRYDFYGPPYSLSDDGA